MPSSKSTKGTEAVLRAVDDAKKEIDFDFRLIHGVGRAEALVELSQCDVFLDQFVLGAYGLATVEAMALGKPTVCYIKDSIVGTYPEDLPVINANQDDLPTVLTRLLKSNEQLGEIGRRSRAYVERHHCCRRIARQLKGIYQQAALSC
jgi:glycosyltransferase involved in cell wall biosynthesis